VPDHGFILASASPRRIALLRDAGFLFDVEPADIDESVVPHGLTPTELAIHLARSKAAAVAKRHPSGMSARVVLGADTVVALGNELFGKAESPAEAHVMLRRLAGTCQSVITGIAVRTIDGQRELFDAAESVVEMKPMSDTQIAAYVETGQWRGKAGAYGIQDHDPENDPFVRLVTGGFDNVVGLPVSLASRLLESLGVVR
jgi:septum formation protein